MSKPTDSQETVTEEYQEPAQPLRRTDSSTVDPYRERLPSSTTAQRETINRAKTLSYDAMPQKESGSR